MTQVETIRVVDSHTGGEPTRTVVEGFPALRGRTMAGKLASFREKFDAYRSAIVNEPRGSDVLVGALLCEPVDPGCAAGVIFFNNVGYLGMCGHGTIGVVATLAWLGRIGPGEHRIETPVGEVRAVLHPDGRVSVRNVPSYRLRHAVRIEVEDFGPMSGDVAWGGNWFFLVADHGQELHLRNVDRLMHCTKRIREALERTGLTGESGALIDHVELFGPPGGPNADSRNFVLCPGLAYDRSPCGTGTSAKLACLHADGKLKPGMVWRQEGIVGSIFEGSIEIDGNRVIPTITGSASVNADARLILDPADPFRMGIRHDLA
jgi:4-hydroxyproline epimerase